MGVVYKINFPDGSFYIGSTQCIQSRIHQHKNQPSKRIKEKLDEYNFSISEFRDLFSVLHEGEDFREVEKDIIELLRNDLFILNTVGVKEAKKLGAVLQVYFPSKKEIEKVKKDAAKKGFNSAASYIRELINQDKKKAKK